MVKKKNNDYSKSADSVPDIVPYNLQILDPLTLTRILYSRHYCHPHFADEKARQSKVI